MTLAQVRPGSLADALREGSRAEHRRAEEAPFLVDLVAGRSRPGAYAGYLLRLRGVYEALESALRRHARHPLVAAVHDPSLDRLASLDADLDHWLPRGPRSIDSAAVAAYRARIDDADRWPGLLVAHHYTRYLGDLSGGQVLGRLVDRAFELGGRGSSFYEFPAIPAPARYKKGYRERLDGLDLGGNDRDRLVTEVNVAFGLNRALLAELSP